HLASYRVIVAGSVVAIDDFTTGGGHLRPAERIVAVQSGRPVAAIWFIVPFGLNNRNGVGAAAAAAGAGVAGAGAAAGGPGAKGATNGTPARPPLRRQPRLRRP